MSNVKLKYLFAVEYVDGSFFHQEPNDVSKIDPKKSAFYDVLNSGKEIAKFTLKPASVFNWGPNISVDLRDGTFEVMRQKIFIDEELPGPAKRELIFFRQHQQDAVATYQVKTGNLLSLEPTEHRIKYFIGWQANLAGKNYQRKIGII